MKFQKYQYTSMAVSYRNTTGVSRYSILICIAHHAIVYGGVPAVHASMNIDRGGDKDK